MHKKLLALLTLTVLATTPVFAAPPQIQSGANFVATYDVSVGPGFAVIVPEGHPDHTASFDAIICNTGVHAGRYIIVPTVQGDPVNTLPAGSCTIQVNLRALHLGTIGNFSWTARVAIRERQAD